MTRLKSSTMGHGMSEACLEPSTHGRSDACHPIRDNDCDQERFVPVKADDPRLLGEGPCNALHELKSEGCQELPDVSIHGNQYGRWVECKICALRLGYWPRTGARGRPAGGPMPDAVRAAFVVLREAGKWECCKAVDMRAALLAVERRRRAGQGIASCAAGATAGNGKAMPRRPASCGAGTARQPAVHPRQRATSVAADGSATRHIMVQVLVDIV